MGKGLGMLSVLLQYETNSGGLSEGKEEGSLNVQRYLDARGRMLKKGEMEKAVP